MQKQHDDFDNENPRPWPDHSHPERAGAIAIIGFVALMLCAAAFNFGRDYLPGFLTWVHRIAPHLWALFHR